MTIITELLPRTLPPDEPAVGNVNAYSEPLRVNLGADAAHLPRFGVGTVGNPVAITGLLDIPKGQDFRGQSHGAALAGYARSAQGRANAVGVFGQGTTFSNDPELQAWGGVFAVSNSGSGLPAWADPNGGNEDVTIYGIEIDVNNVPGRSGRGAANVRGLWITGGSTSQPSQRSIGVDVGPCGQAIGNLAIPLPWKHAFHTEDGAAQVGMEFGCLSAAGPE